MHIVLIELHQARRDISPPRVLGEDPDEIVALPSAP
jgi:hypothetical protein